MAINQEKHVVSVITKLVNEFDVLFEPMIQRPKGRPKSKKKRGITSMRRDPSRFELVESSQRHNSSSSNGVLQRNNVGDEESNLIDLNVFPNFSNDYTSFQLND